MHGKSKLLKHKDKELRANTSKKGALAFDYIVTVDWQNESQCEMSGSQGTLWKTKPLYNTAKFNGS